MECRLAGETEVLGENQLQRHFCPSQNPTWPIRILTRAAAVTTYILTELNPSWEAANCAATQELPSILRNPNVHHHVHKSPALVPILSQIGFIIILYHFHVVPSCGPHICIAIVIIPDMQPKILYAFLMSVLIITDIIVYQSGTRSVFDYEAWFLWPQPHNPLDASDDKIITSLN
jgi:hypothetical protein